MSKISDVKKDRIKEDLIRFLYESSPIPHYTVEIARELVRDEEFILSLLIELKNKRLVKVISKNKKGVIYLARRKWQLTDEAYMAFKNLNS